MSPWFETEVVEDTSVSEPERFFCVWAQESPYWVVVEGPLAQKTLPGLTPMEGHAQRAYVHTPPHWRGAWGACAQVIASTPGASAAHRVAVIPQHRMPEPNEISDALRPIGTINNIAEHLWLVEAIHRGGLSTYFQAVVDRRQRVGGYESFARLEVADGGIIGGGAVMQAAHVLKVEHQLDRLLHRLAIERFATSNLKGYLFINFLASFLHRPAEYLECLNQAMLSTGIRPGSVVLDLPYTYAPHELPQLRAVAAYCHERGLSLGIDDVTSPEGLPLLLEQLRPAFVKFDFSKNRAATTLRAQAELTEIVALCHQHGVNVLAENIETARQFEHYLAAEVDLFQGYLFGMPERLSA